MPTLYKKKKIIVEVRIITVLPTAPHTRHLIWGPKNTKFQLTHYYYICVRVFMRLHTQSTQYNGIYCMSINYYNLAWIYIHIYIYKKESNHDGHIIVRVGQTLEQYQWFHIEARWWKELYFLGCSHALVLVHRWWRVGHLRIKIK